MTTDGHTCSGYCPTCDPANPRVVSGLDTAAATPGPTVPKMTMRDALNAFEVIRDFTRVGEAVHGIATLAVQRIRAESVDGASVPKPEPGSLWTSQADPGSVEIKVNQDVTAEQVREAVTAVQPRAAAFSAAPTSKAGCEHGYPVGGRACPYCELIRAAREQCTCNDCGECSRRAAAPGQSTPVETPPAEPVKPADPIPMRLPCPSCGKLHLDVGEFATKSHHTHACQHCGMVWRPAVVATVGVEFLPGYKNEPAPTAPAPPGPVKPKPKEKPMRTKCCCDPRCIEAVEQGVDCPIHDVAPAPGVGEPRELTFAEAMAMVYGGRRVDYLLDGEWRPFPPPAIYVADIPALVKGQWRERPEPLPAPAPRVSRVQMLRAEWEQEDFDAPTRADVDRLCERVVEETLKAVRATYNPLGDVAKTLDRARTAMLEPPACPGRRP